MGDRVMAQLARDTRAARIETEGLVQARRDLLNAQERPVGVSRGTGGGGGGGGGFERAVQDGVRLLNEIAGSLRGNAASAAMRGFRSS